MNYLYWGGLCLCLNLSLARIPSEAADDTSIKKCGRMLGASIVDDGESLAEFREKRDAYLFVGIDNMN